MNQKVKKQSNFHQIKMNEAKLGAYYTDPKHCEWISNLLEFNEEGVCCLEPAIGDAGAVIAITKRPQNQRVHIFGVELNEQTTQIVRKNGMVDECIWGDFLTDVVISNRVFSFCFSNPPYGEESGVRLEKRFLQKIVNYLSKKAVLVYVIPQYVAMEEKFLLDWCRSFETEQYYRFHEGEYSKWRQVVLIGRRKDVMSADREAVMDMKKKLSIVDDIPLLPENYQGERVYVYASNDKDIQQFTTKQFDADYAKEALRHSPLADIVKDSLQQKKYITERLGRPPIMPNASQMYLMAVTGAGQGKVGSEESGDLHLQRGVVKNVTESEMQYDESGRMVEAVQTFSRIHFHIIENDGKIHTL